jgi:death-on-curing protein
MIPLKRKYILKINRRTVKENGGSYSEPENLKNPTSFEYMVEAVNVIIAGEEIYPQIWDKAAFYLHKTNSSHLFWDGNKRTGLESALSFLKLNGHRLRIDLKPVFKEDNTRIPVDIGSNGEDLLVNFVLEVADSKHTLEDCSLWFKANVIEITSKSS